ncbi:hypothetical protein SEA_NICEHOUSE_85 [Rhodococcus phage NiceHouse]|nr:hypothetical protein SEA_NICEHOUSE_85 [Rhodococcus phage NiceHouse]
MEVTLKQVDAIMSLFHQLQQKHGYKDYTNVVRAKWDMLAVARAVDSSEELTQLIQFFMLYSDDKSYKTFFDKYDSYLETMLRVKADRLHRMWLQQETLRKSENAKREQEQKLEREEKLES